MNWYLEVLRKYAVFEGRARRQEYWTFVLINTTISLGLGLLERALGFAPDIDQSVLSSIYALAVLVPSLAVGVRRLHDTGRSGWYMFLVLIPILGSIALLVLQLFDSDPGNNQYGSNPKEAPAP